jgi:hypothetical protein
MVKSKTPSDAFSENQIEDLLELRRDIVREKMHRVEDEISYFPFLSLAMAFVFGLALGVVLSPRPND